MTTGYEQGKQMAEARTDIISYMVEYRWRAGGRWLTWPSPADEHGATREYHSRLAWQRRTVSRQTEYRLVKRTAVITDEILASDEEVISDATRDPRNPGTAPAAGPAES